jgi:hypothetical protein
MATTQQIASAGAYITDDVGVEVTDGTSSRVQMGKLPSGQYGLRVVSSDGTTVIIDGTSDVFKIVASGTDSFTIAGVATTTSPQNNQTHVTSLPGLGTFAVQQAHLSFVSPGTGSAGEVAIGRYPLIAGNHFSSTVVTPYTAVNGAFTMALAYWSGYLTAGVQQIVFAGSNWLTTSQTFSGRYFIMSEAGL